MRVNVAVIKCLKDSGTGILRSLQIPHMDECGGGGGMGGGGQRTYPLLPGKVTGADACAWPKSWPAFYAYEL